MMDLFPTMLSAMGYEIEGNRLGLGTDLFSGRATLAEEMGYEGLNEEVQKYSQYFIDHFAR
jgi:phosphoglycerol transferase